MVTHHPLAIAELEKEQVQVMWSDSEYQVHAREPADSPKGMGYAGILTSDMFGLRTTLDNYSERLLRIRRKFSEKEVLTSIQQARLEKIDAALEQLGFSTAHWDTEYSLYLRVRKEMERDVLSVDSGPDLTRLRKIRAQEIVKRILESEKEEQKRNEQSASSELEQMNEQWREE